ncbi:uncharacterized protein [Atheta coriaria]|uniref:uncharacterized protein n=1 Tax=Dalotia coriaria TaxID=877792 RepID=UPI0031F46EA5
MSKSPEYKDYKQDYGDYDRNGREYNRDNRDRDYPDRYYDVEDTLKSQQGRSDNFNMKNNSREGRNSREIVDRYHNDRHIERYPERSDKHKDHKDRQDRQERQDRRREVSSPDEEETFQDNFSVLHFSPRERFNDAKEKFLLLEKKTSGNSQDFFTREMPISPNISKDKRNSRYYDDEPIPAPRNFKSSQDERNPERRTNNSRGSPKPPRTIQIQPTKSRQIRR